MQLGFSTWGMPAVPIDAIVRHLSGLGFDGVELTVLSHHTTALESLDKAERSRILKLLQDHGLQLPAIAGHVSLMDEDSASHAANFERLKSTMDLALDWANGEGPPVIDTTAGGAPEDWDSNLGMLVERSQLQLSRTSGRLSTRRIGCLRLSGRSILPPLASTSTSAIST